MIRWLQNLLSLRQRPRMSQFDLAIAALLIRDAARQEVDGRTPPSPPPKPIGLRKVLADLPD
jgi:hypothetical protein